MSISSEELEFALKHMANSPWFREFLLRLGEYLGDKYHVCFRIFNPKVSKYEDTTGITAKSVVILWGDERSTYLPTKYLAAAGRIVKYHLPPSWMSKGFEPVTDTAFAVPSEGQLQDLRPCSERPYPVFYSGNLNYRRLDLFRGLAGVSYGYPFRIPACYPINGCQPILQKLHAMVMNKIISGISGRRDFSSLFPGSYIVFTNGFGKGLTKDEYLERMLKSKISLCPPGFVTNETIRLLESCLCGTAVVCGRLPDLPMYEGHPFVEISDWRRIKWVIDDLLSDEDRLDEIGQAGRMWYDSHFSPDAQAKRIAKSILGK